VKQKICQGCSQENRKQASYCNRNLITRNWKINKAKGEQQEAKAGHTPGNGMEGHKEEVGDINFKA
jgi:hypothetical protein